ncbi:MAG: transcriptional regulator [Flavobacteriales bacterium]|nr:helix-turn-helix transcriptional regulator [Flavobacteriales bacterium]MBQ21168.1 transcriptional regulator [Flavobacteriales bacterium]|tara:strand:- start:55263 stop:55586 length:324 start_codon:yes stop_codon:yes gene_type:complete
MGSFGKFIKTEREKKGWSQTEFGALIKINTPAISGIENDRKSFSVAKLELLAKLFKLDYNTVKDFYFADKFAKEAYQYNCTEKVHALAENQSKYLRNKNVKQGKIKF